MHILGGRWVGFHLSVVCIMSNAMFDKNVR